MAERTFFFHPNGECKLLHEALGSGLPRRTFLETFRPRPDMYLRPDAMHGLHGDAHSARVNVWAQVLTSLADKRGVVSDPTALGMYALTHDLRRVDDCQDPGHGVRAADFFRAQYGTGDEVADTVAYLNTWHVPDDERAPVMTTALAMAKDADNLDRVREKGEFDARYLRLPESRQLLVVPAQALFILSSQLQQERGFLPFDSVMEAAVRLGIVLDG